MNYSVNHSSVYDADGPYAFECMPHLNNNLSYLELYCVQKNFMFNNMRVYTYMLVFI